MQGFTFSVLLHAHAKTKVFVLGRVPLAHEAHMQGAKKVGGPSPSKYCMCASRSKILAKGVKRKGLSHLVEEVDHVTSQAKKRLAPSRDNDNLGRGLLEHPSMTSS